MDLVADRTHPAIASLRKNTEHGRSSQALLIRNELLVKAIQIVEPSSEFSHLFFKSLLAASRWSFRQPLGCLL